MEQTNGQNKASYPLLRVTTFGEFTLERLVSALPDSQGIPHYRRILPDEWNNRSSALLLLKILLCYEQRRAAKEDLISLLWPGKTDINTDHAFDSAASILRRRILSTCTGENLLVTLHTARSTSFKLAPQSLLWVDADALLALSTQAFRVANRGQNALPLLEKAYALAHGEFLEDDMDFVWTQRRRHTLNGARRRMLYKLIELYMKEKCMWQAEEILYAFLEEYPTDEDALCRLMTLLSEQGRRQEALQLYRYTVDLLHEEQRGPTFYTKELAVRIRNGVALKEQASNYIAACAAIVSSPEWRRKTKTLRNAWAYALQIQMAVINISLYSIFGREVAMRMEVDKICYDNYQFRVELDTGAETGTNQLTVWFAEKTDSATIPLTHFKPAQLFNALREPYKTSLQVQLEQEKADQCEPFQTEIASLQSASLASSKKIAPAKIKRQLKDVRKEMNITLHRLEADFMHRALSELDRNCFDLAYLQRQSHFFGDERFLRDFYFEEANKQHIRNFCRKFALNAAYRYQVMTREVWWAKRNALFLRNLFPLFGMHMQTANSYEYENKAHDFFHWMNKHYEAILALPDYQYLQEIDTAFVPDANELDPSIRPAVELFNRIPGVTTRYSCQGISGKIHFQGRNLLVVSEHEEYAYVSFVKMEPLAKQAIEELLPHFPVITDAPLPGHFTLWSVLRSTGDNIRFRAELVALAQQVLDHYNSPAHLA